MLSTYRAATLNIVVAAAGSAMFFVITGSASVTRRVRKIRVSGDTLTTLAVGSIVAEKWGTTAPTGGTATTLTRVPLDSAFPAAQTDGLVQVYTVAPTEGTLVGTIACRRHVWKSATVVDAPFAETEFDFDNKGDDGRLGIPLHGLTQALSLAFGADPASAITLAVEVEWTEEAGP
mgnify:CR=1 FL=1